MTRSIVFHIYRLCCRKVAQEGWLQRAEGTRHGEPIDAYYYGRNPEDTERNFKRLLDREMLRGLKLSRVTGIEPHVSYDLIPFWDGRFWK